MSERILYATLGVHSVGLLGEQAGQWFFTYDESWLGHPQAFALSPFLPLQLASIVDDATNRHVQWYFDNLLPEEGQRQLMAKEAKTNVADAFELLAWYGMESAGSLTLSRDKQLSLDPGDVTSLTDTVLDRRINALPMIPLTQDSPKRMSLAGAQHKLAVVYDNDSFFEPRGAHPSTHIVKPDHPHLDYPRSVANEWFVMRLAAASGLSVPPTTRRYVPAPVYVVKRFDRVQSGGLWQRLHAIDACQLLGMDRQFKYRQGSIDTLTAIAEHCRTPALARTRLYSWLVFNLLIGNTDAHLKNLSFLVSGDGILNLPSNNGH